MLNAVYDRLGQLTALTDAYGAPASLGSGGLDGSGGTSQTVTDLSPQHNTTESVYDDHGNVVRQIQSVKDDAGNVLKYVVTVTDYNYFSGGLGDELGSVFLDYTTPGGTAGVSNQNALLSVVQYQSFEVPVTADDPTAVAIGMRSEAGQAGKTGA